MTPDVIQMIERFGSLALLMWAGWWILAKQIPSERDAQREMVRHICEQFTLSLREERDLVRSVTEASQQQTIVLQQLVKDYTRDLSNM